jgi:formylglycine-generating enzyme required for sulfatase activity
MEVFFSYAREDEQLQAALIKHLTLLPIEAWYDRQITAGEEWRNVIDNHLKSAEIILLLISSDFLASEYCQDIELKLALQRHEKGAARVIPVILRPVDWHRASFGKFAALPSNGQPITTWNNRDEAFTNVAKGLQKVIEDLQKQQLVNRSTVEKTTSKVPDRPSWPPMQKISYVSVRLDSSGKVLEQPSGSATIFQEDLGEGVSMRMVQIPAGQFTLGSPTTEKERRDNEGSQHLLTVPEFYMGQTLVTQAQWRAVMGSNPSHFTGNDKLPVDSVSWLDAKDFCQELRQMTGRAYQLPSEAQWEYACRAGSNVSTPFSFGETITSSLVNYNGNDPYANAAQGESRAKTTIVGSFPTNLFGLYDMHGNLWEWCLDEWTSNYNDVFVDGSARGDINSRNSDVQRLLRGGSWINNARKCRSAKRNYNAASNRNYNCGLRVVAVASSTPSRQNF